MSRLIASEREGIRFSNRKSSIRVMRSVSITSMILGFSVGMIDI